MTTAEWVRLLAIVFSSTSVVSLVLVRAQWRKLRSEADKTSADYVQVISGTAVSLLEPMRQQIDTLQTQLRAAHEEITTLRTAMAGLTAELDAARRRSARDRGQPEG